MPIAADAPGLRKDEIADRLSEARARTLELVAPLTDEQLNHVYSELLSPLAWDLGHIANFEELWLVQRVGGRDPLRGELGRLYDAIENPRATRNQLPILRGEELRAYMDGVRARTLHVLEDLSANGSDPLLRDGFIYEMLIAHEHQHGETMLQLLQMIEEYEPVARNDGPQLEPAGAGPEMVRVEGGDHEIGHDGESFAYDNERERHTVTLAPFWIDRTPVTNAAFAEFVADTGAGPPRYWKANGAGGWTREVMGETEEVDPRLPVVHVDHAQAEAFAGWAGKRLPTEHEWEAAAVGADRDRANLDQISFGCAAAGAYADAASDFGAVQMLGDVWEWTSSDFTPYPGFEPFPYPEYSEAFFGSKYKVLRGGSWATRRNVARITFRNWDLPARSQIFSGIRCVREDG